MSMDALNRSHREAPDWPYPGESYFHSDSAVGYRIDEFRRLLGYVGYYDQPEDYIGEAETPTKEEYRQIASELAEAQDLIDYLLEQHPIL